MQNKETIQKQIIEQGLMTLFYHDSAEVSIHILNTLHKAGIRIIEYTNRGSNALPNFIALRKAIDTNFPEMALGIGTIKTEQQAQSFIDAGADFIICPTVNVDVARITHNAGLLWIPGCFTPTEISLAEASGASIVKIFPCSVLSTSYISTMREIFPNLLFMPTGGVDATEENIASWFKAGVVAVGLGSKLVSKEILNTENYNLLETETKRVLSIIQKCKIK